MPQVRRPRMIQYESARRTCTPFEVRREHRRYEGKVRREHGSYEGKLGTRACVLAAIGKDVRAPQ